MDRNTARIFAEAMSGAIPMRMPLDGGMITVATVAVDEVALSASLKARLLANRTLSGAPLGRVLSTWPGVSAATSDARLVEALDHVLDHIVMWTAFGLRAGMVAGAVSLEKHADLFLTAVVQRLRFCASCGFPFFFARSHKRFCSACQQQRPRTPRQRPGHAVTVARRRLRKAIEELRPSYEAALSRAGAQAGPDTRRDLGKILQQYIEGDLKAERQLDALAERRPELAKAHSRLMSYRTRRASKALLPR